MKTIKKLLKIIFEIKHCYEVFFYNRKWDNRNSNHFIYVNAYEHNIKFILSFKFVNFSNWKKNICSFISLIHFTAYTEKIFIVMTTNYIIISDFNNTSKTWPSNVIINEYS